MVDDHVRRLVPMTLLCVGLLILAPATATAQGPNQSTAPPTPQQKMRRALIDRINGIREHMGLPPYEINAALTEAAERHVQDMAANNWRTHWGTDGTSYHQRVARAGYEYATVTENVGWGFNLDRMMDWWLNSHIHRSNLLSTEYTEIGVAYVGDPSSEWGHWWTIVFATPAH